MIRKIWFTQVKLRMELKFCQPTMLSTINHHLKTVHSDVLQLADLPNIDTQEVRSIPESVKLNVIELIDLQSSIQSIITETVKDLNLIELNASSENGNVEWPSQMVH